MKLNLHLRDFACPQCARRFDKEDELVEHVLKHEEWVKKDQVHTGGWYITVDEFLQEKSFEVDTSIDVVRSVVNDYIKHNRPHQAAAMEAVQDFVNEKAEPDQTSSENVKMNPIVPTGVVFRCTLCNEVLEDEDEDYEDRVLKDAVKVTDAGTNTEQFYHRDCYEATKLKPESQMVLFNKPSRWTSAVIDEADSTQPGASSHSRPPSYQTAASIPSTSAQLVKDEPELPSATGSSLVADTKPPEDSGFVISFGDDDEEEDDFDVQADFI